MATNFEGYLAKFACQPMTKSPHPVIPLRSGNIPFEKLVYFFWQFAVVLVMHATILYMRLPLAKQSPTYNMKFKTTRITVRFSLHFKKFLQSSDTSFESSLCDKCVRRHNKMQDWKSLDFWFQRHWFDKFSYI